MGGSAAEWAAEHEVDAGLAARLLAEQVPELAGAPVVPLATGWDHTVHLVDGRWVVRFPRRAIALPGFARELDVLPVLAPLLPLAVPVPLRRGAAGAGFPWPFAASAYLPGRELAAADLPDDRRLPVAAAVGEFLAVLHAPATAAALAAAGADLPLDPFSRADPVVRAPRARPRLERLSGLGLWRPRDPVELLLRDGEALGGPPSEGDAVVVHGDLHVRHVLVDDAGTATAVIDWGDLCRADPAVDLALAYAAFAGPAREALLAAYGGRVTAERELRARVLAVDLSAALAEYAAERGDAALLAESLGGIRRAVSAPGRWGG